MTEERLALGKKAENLAVEHLKKEGYQIVARNVRSSIGELDIIARDGKVMCFVEVRSRTSRDHGHPFESITPVKQRKLLKTALGYIEEHGIEDTDMRFDVVAVIPQDDGTFDLDLLKNAFEVSY